MTVGQKASLSFFIAVLLFAALAVAAFSGLFNVIESSFYNPSIVRGLESSLSKVADEEMRYHASNLARFSSILMQDSVRKSFLPNISSQDSFNRANAFGKLQEETAGLSGLRFIDANGKRIHFSNIPGDIHSKTDIETMYRNYGDTGDLVYDSFSSPEGSKGRVLIDPSSGRFLYSLPFSDSYGIYRGSAVFFVSTEGLVSLLVKDGLASVGESAVPAGAEGILLRVPAAYRAALPGRVAELWAAGLDEKPLPIASSAASGDSFVLFSKKVTGAGRVGYIVNAAEFSLPAAMKWILLGSFFVTAYLLAFLLLNIRQDRMAVLSDRIKRFQISLLDEYVENKSDLDFGRWKRELEARRPEVKKAIRSSVGRIRKNRQTEVDELIDKSWDEILGVLGGRAELERGEGEHSSIGLKEIERLLGDALKNGSFILPPGSVMGTSPQSAAPIAALPAVQVEKAHSEPEEVEELEEAEELEDAQGAVAPPPTEADVPEEPEELEELEEIEELQDEEAPVPAAAAEITPEEPEELEELEEPEEPEELEELEEVEELPAESNLRTASAQAYALASAEDDDIPLIPESSGLELADEANIADLIGFIDVEEGGDKEEDIELLEPEEAVGDERMEQEKPAASSLDIESGLAPLEEVDFELLLSSIDLSSLEQWDRGPAGAEEADATRSAETTLSLSSPIAEAAEETEEIPPPDEAEGSSAEILEAPEAGDEGSVSEIDNYLGPWISYRPFSLAAGGPAEGELPVVGEGEPYVEAEFLGDLEESMFEVDAPPTDVDGIIEYHDGVFRLNPDRSSSEADFSGDPELRALVDSVLGDES